MKTKVGCAMCKHYEYVEEKRDEWFYLYSWERYANHLCLATKTVATETRFNPIKGEYEVDVTKGTVKCVDRNPKGKCKFYDEVEGSD